MQNLEFPSASSGELKDKLRQNLARIFEFSPEDLTQNQAGKFGEGQTRRIGAKVATPLYRCAAVALFWITFIWMLNHSTWFASFFTYYLHDGFRRTFAFSSPATVLVGLMFSLAPWFWNSSPGTAFFLLIDFMAGGVAKAEGKVWLSQATGRDAASSVEPDASITDYQYAVGDLKFDVPYDAAAALDENAPYRIYYAPRSNVLLSIEPI